MAEFLLGILFFILLQVANTAPAFHFPLIIELFALSASAFIALSCLKSEQFKRPNKSVIQVLSFLGILTLLQVLRTFSSAAVVADEAVCKLMPGLLQKLECMMQMESSALPGARQLSYSLAAASLFAAISYKSTISPSAIRKFLNGGLFVAAGIGFVSLLGYYGRVKITLPNWFFVNEFGPACLFMQNPSWIWPWCTPWISYSFWNFFSIGSNHNWNRFFFVFSAAVLLLYSVSSSQRGAALQVLVVAAASVMSFLLISSWRQRFTKKAQLAISTFGILGPIATVSLFFLAPTAINMFFGTIGIRTRVGGGESSLSHERLEMWRIAWGGIKESFWLGHGQGSWTREFGKLAHSSARPDLVFDTAHNFFVQSLFELGFLHFTMLLCFFAFIFKTVSNKLNEDLLVAKKIWFVGVLAAYSVILAVQEVDFVRSSFYQHAVFWGFLFGHSTAVATSAGAESEHIKEHKIESWKFRAFRLGTAIVLLSALSLAALSLLGFSLAGYQYEANARNGYNPKVRWIGSSGTLNYVLPRADEENPIARFRVLKSFATEYLILSAQGWKQVPIANPEVGPSFIDIPVSSGFQLPKVVKFTGAQNDYGRHISVLVAWPPEIIEGEK